MTPTSIKKVEQKVAIEAIHKAIKGGRGIVPLLGSGISVDSGIPTLAGLASYLTKFKFYVSNSLYQIPPPDRPTQRRYVDEGLQFSAYLRLNGWPDVCDLDEMLWQLIYRWIEEGARSQQSPIWRSALARAIQSQLVTDFKSLHGQPSSPQTKKYLDLLRNSGMVALKPDWRTMLYSIADGDSAHVDSLFQRLCDGRRPTIAHRFLCFLAQEMGWQLFLTSNFDSLLEDAFRLEGMSPAIFDITSESNLPHPELLRNRLSIVKLHGGAFGLRVGERLDQPLDEESRTRVLRYMPENPLLIVLGFSGSERHMMEIIETISQVKGSLRNNEPRVVWVHYETELPDPVNWLGEKTRGSIYTTRTRDVGAFLIELYTTNTNEHPVSNSPYVSYTHRPFGYFVPTSDPSTKKEQLTTNAVKVAAFTDERVSPIHAFVSVLQHLPGGGNPSGSHKYDPQSTTKMMTFVSSKLMNRTAIHVNLQHVHSIEELATEILEECRSLDRQLPPLHLPSYRALDDDAENRYAKLIRRLSQAFRRKAYLLALDDVAEFVRPPTIHDGVGVPLRSVTPDKLSDDLDTFLTELIGKARWLGESTVVLALDRLNLRYSDGPSHIAVERVNNRMLKLAEQFRSIHKQSPKLVRFIECKTTGPSTKESSAARGSTDAPKWLVTPVTLLAVMRRARSQVAVEALAEFRTLFPGVPSQEKSDQVNDKCDGVIQKFDDVIKKDGARSIRQAEGRYYWMPPVARDRLYQDLARGTSSSDIKSVMAGRNGNDHVLCLTLSKLYLLAYYHKRLAHYYYSQLFLSSHDVYPLLEFLYHRIASIRYLTKLSFLAHDVGRLSEEDTFETYFKVWLKDTVKDRDHILNIEPRHESCLLHLISKPDVIDAARLREVKALFRTCEREREYILSTIAPVKLCNWIEHILNEDVSRFLLHSLKGATSGGRASDEARVADVTMQFTRWLCDLRATALLESTEYAACFSQRRYQIDWEAAQKTVTTKPADIDLFCAGLFRTSRKQLGAQIREAKLKAEVKRLRISISRWKRKNSWKPTSTRGSDILRYAVDVGACLRGLRRLQECKKILETSQKVIEAIAPESSTDGRADLLLGQHSRELNRLKMKVQFRLADAALASVSPWRQGTESAEVVKNRTNALKIARKYCEDGLEFVRGVAPKKAGDFHHYRCTFHAIHARATYLQMSFRSFDGAIRELELAPGGILASSGANRISLAIRNLYMAECFLLRQRERLIGADGEGNRDEDTDKPGAGAGDPAIESLIKVSLLQAESAIKRAESLLTDGRKSVRWWSCLYQLTAQLKVEQLKSHLSFASREVHANAYGDLSETGAWQDDTTERGALNLSARMSAFVTEGLFAIRNGLDCDISSSKSVDGAIDSSEQWLLRAWIEMFCYATALSIGERTCDQTTSDCELKSILNITELFDGWWQGWRWLNDRCGLSKFTDASGVENIILVPLKEKLLSIQTKNLFSIETTRLVRAAIGALVKGGAVRKLRQAVSRQSPQAE